MVDTSYEWKAVTLLGLGFGLVALDRWIIAPLFPFMMKDLGLGYQELGNISRTRWGSPGASSPSSRAGSRIRSGTAGS